MNAYLADLIILLHLAFILFVLFGAVLVLKFPRLIWLHVPAVIWGVWVEVSGSICPLTFLENSLRQGDGGQGYTSGFIEQYLQPIIYPSGLTREIQLLLGLALLIGNVFCYLRLFSSSRAK